MKKLILLLLFSVSVFGATFEDAKEAYLNATLDVEKLNSEGLPRASLEDLLDVMNVSLYGRDEGTLKETAILLNESEDGKELAQKYFALIAKSKLLNRTPGQDFEFVVEKSQYVHEMKNSAFDAYDAVSLLNVTITNTNETVNLSEVLRSFEGVIDAFNSERYESVFSRINDTYLLLEEAEVSAARERAFLRLAQRNVFSFVKNHWISILIVLLLLSLISIWARLEHRVYYAEKKVKLFAEELKAVKTSHVAIQKQYYSGQLGRTVYKSRLEQYSEKERALKSKHDAWLASFEKYKKQSLISKFR